MHVEQLYQAVQNQNVSRSVVKKQNSMQIRRTKKYLTWEKGWTVDPLKVCINWMTKTPESLLQNKKTKWLCQIIHDEKQILNDEFVKFWDETLIYA